MQCHEIPEPVVGCEPKRLQRPRPGHARIRQPPRYQPARDNDPNDAVAVAQRQQAGRRGVDQLIIVERAIGTRNTVEALVGPAERPRQRPKVGFLGYGIGADQDPLGAHSDRSGAPVGSGDDAMGQKMANAIEFRAGAGMASGQAIGSHRKGQKPAVEPISPRGAANGCPNNASERHRRPPDATR